MANNSEQKLLYHYTSIFAFNEIVTKKAVFASDCRFLNDLHELKAAEALLVSLVRDEGQRAALKYALHFIETRDHYCVFSLSESPRILSQWRAYAENGQGVAIGFVADYIADGWFSDKADLVRCVYENHEAFLETLAESESATLQQLDQVLRVECGTAVNVYLGWLLDHPDVLHRIMIGLLSVKNAAFREELEWRAIYRVQYGEIETRVRDGLIVPFKRFRIWKQVTFDRPGDLSNFAVMMREVWLGPKTAERNRAAIKSFNCFGLEIERYDCGFG